MGTLKLKSRHRLVCGDCTDPKVVDLVMGENKADLCFTSPPYALGSSVALSGNKNMSQKGNAYDSHADDSESWPALMDGWWKASLRAVAKVWVVNVQPLAGNKRELMKWIHERSPQLVDIATWDKGHAAPQIAPGVMASRFEWMVVLGKENATRAIPCASWQGTVQSVYCGPPQRNNEFASVHAATMPVHVPFWVIGTLCDKATSVYEPFCGTGTTLIACEQLGRSCFGIELSPVYCDVIVKRFENMKGEKAIRWEP